MGRNIRFLQSELEPFRAQFKQEMENGKTKLTRWRSLQKEVAARSGGSATGTVTENGTWKRLTPKIGRRRSVDCANVYKLAIKTPCRRSAGAKTFCSTNGWSFFWRTIPSPLFGLHSLTGEHHGAQAPET
jgi:hypothetical protein